MKPQVGQTVYLLELRRKEKLVPTTVTKVARKYFYVKNGLKFHNDDWIQKSDYSISHKCFSSEQEWEDDKEKEQLDSEIRQFFRYKFTLRELTLEQLKAIKLILEL